MSRFHRNRRFKGFTLAELLISLAILAVIATFTIPKVLQSQQDSSYKAIAKESVAMVSASWQQTALNGTLTTSTAMSDLTQYMNYVAVDSSSVIDDKRTLNSITCGSGAWANCLRLHNGAMMRYGNSTFAYGGTGTTNAIWFDIDPDGKLTDSSTNGPGKAIEFWLYYNGKITTFGTVLPNTCFQSTCVGPTPAADPSWFNWN